MLTQGPVLGIETMALYFFSCDMIAESMLRETVAFLNMEESIDEATANAMTYFHWRHGLGNCRPGPIKKIVFIPWSDPPSTPAEVWYHSRRLFYRMVGHFEVEMLDLETGKKESTWIGEEELAIEERKHPGVRSIYSFHPGTEVCETRGISAQISDMEGSFLVGQTTVIS